MKIRRSSVCCVFIGTWLEWSSLKHRISILRPAHNPTTRDKTLLLDIEDKHVSRVMRHTACSPETRERDKC
jgi:hypothetical protein